MLNRLSITSQMIISLVLTSFIIVLSGMSFNMWNSVQYEKESYLNNSVLEAELIADLITAPLAFDDYDGVDKGLEKLGSRSSVRFAVVYSKEKEVIAVFNPKKIILPDNASAMDNGFYLEGSIPWDFGVLKSSVEIKEDNQLLGYLHVEKDTEMITSFVSRFVFKSIAFLVFLMVLVYFVAKSLSKKILQPIVNIASVAEEVSNTKDYSIRVSLDAKNEIKSLYDSFNTLLIDTESLTNDLESRVKERTKDLEESIDKLNKARDQLIESEKMAALGNLVSGVAHEVNTPLGNALTGGSIIEQEAKVLLKHLNEGTMKKSTLSEGLNTLSESAKVLIISITRAANLVKSFKRISVDQSVETRQKFNLLEYIEEILLTFKNKLKSVAVEAYITGEHNLVIESYPGIYAQVISNLIQNSIVHGFQNPVENARIMIYIEDHEDEFTITYSDNGEGMSDKVKKIAFEPFVTTKRSEGGTGLGLNIIYNLVVQKLGGTIKMSENDKPGVEFIIKLPKTVK